MFKDSIEYFYPLDFPLLSCKHLRCSEHSQTQMSRCATAHDLYVLWLRTHNFIHVSKSQCMFADDDNNNLSSYKEIIENNQLLHDNKMSNIRNARWHANDVPNLLWLHIWCHVRQEIGACCGTCEPQIWAQLLHYTRHTHTYNNQTWITHKKHPHWDGWLYFKSVMMALVQTNDSL